MASDSIVVTGPVMQQVSIGDTIVTPTGGSQSTLKAILGTVVGSTTITASVTGSAATLPITGLAAAQGGSVTVKGGTSSTSANAGGAAAVLGGTPGATGIGGVASVTGGAGLGGAAGGAARLIGGAGQGAGAGGAITITSGAAGATGVAGAVAISVGGATAGNGSAITVTGGAGAGGTASGGNINLVGGTAVSTGAPGEVQINADSSLSFASYYFTGSPAATDQAFFVAPRALRVKTISCVFATAAGGASTLTVIKDTGTAAPGAGTSLHQSGSFNLNATANTVQTATVATTVATVNMAAGDRLSVKFANAIQATAGLVITVGMNPV
jgi:hypothetical protein